MGKFKQKVKTAQSRMGEETHLTRDVPKLNSKEILLWAGTKPPVGRSDSNEDDQRCLCPSLNETHTGIDLFDQQVHPRGPRPGWPASEERSGQGAKSSQPFFLGQGWSVPFHAFQISKGQCISLPEHLGVTVMWKSWEKP